MTGPTYQGLKPQKIAVERDFTFGMESKEEPSVKEEAPETERRVEVQTKLLPVMLVLAKLCDITETDKGSSRNGLQRSWRTCYLQVWNSTELL